MQAAPKTNSQSAKSGKSCCVQSSDDKDLVTCVETQHERKKPCWMLYITQHCSNAKKMLHFKQPSLKYNYFWKSVSPVFGIMFHEKVHSRTETEFLRPTATIYLLTTGLPLEACGKCSPVQRQLDWRCVRGLDDESMVLRPAGSRTDLGNVFCFSSPTTSPKPLSLVPSEDLHFTAQINEATGLCLAMGLTVKT